MDVGEEDEAEAFDGDDYVAVFAHALHCAFVAGIYACCYSYLVSGPEIRFGVYLATCAVVSAVGQQAQQAYLGFVDGTDIVGRGVAVYPECGQRAVGAPGSKFEFDGLPPGGADEEHMRYERPAYLTALRGAYGLARKEYFDVGASECVFEQAFPACLDGIPSWRGVVTHIYI